MKKTAFALSLVLALVLARARPLAADDAGTRFLRYPDLSRDRIAFVYAGDVWTVPREGGEAHRITSHPGLELFPKFSPDGRWIAFSGEYSGTRQVYVVPAEGGEPKQLTFYNDIGELPPRGGYDNQILGWTPDGKKVVFRANRVPYDERLGRPFAVPATGGMEEPLRIPELGSGDFSGDGTRYAFTPIARDYRTWKRHRGGRTPDVWIYDFARDTAERITDSPASDTWPMWLGDRIHFASDRDHTMNLFAYDTKAKTTTKVTNQTAWDVAWPSAGPDAIVYEAGGWIWRFDPASGESVRVPIEVHGDFPETVPGFRDASRMIERFELSPSGKRALFVARGDLFTVPAEKGEIRNLTRTSGVRERDAAWSPDGKWLAYLSDRTGENEIYVRAADSSGDERRVTTDAGPWRLAPVWSPDSKRLVYGDTERRLRIVEVESGRIVDADRAAIGIIDTYRWSPDGRYVAYVKVEENQQSTIWVYALDEKKAHRLSDGQANDFEPVFDPKGRYLYFLSNRDFKLQFSGFESSYLYVDPTRIYVGALTAETPGLFPPESDEEGAAAKPNEGQGSKEPAKVAIDWEGFPSRVRAIPGDPADYRALAATADALYSIRGDGRGEPALYRFDLAARDEKKVLDGLSAYALSADGKKVLAQIGKDYALVDAAPDQKTDAKLDLARMQARVVPREEWAEEYRDAWRIVRDWFYDPKLHGRDWKALGDRYAELVPFIAVRSDLDDLLGQLVAELGVGHAYVERPDGWSPVERKDGGLLGAEIVADASGYFRIGKIFRGENWHEDFRSPLTEPGVRAAEGELILAIDGISTKGVDNVYRLLENKGNRTVALLLNAKPTTAGAHVESVQTIVSEQHLRYLDWVERNRRRVEAASGGRIGYIHVPNTSEEGNRELFRHFYPLSSKDALLIDDRYNGGGFIPNTMIALLARPLLNYWVRRGEAPAPTPGFVHPGPKACLINWNAGSGGDALPYYFKELGLGPLIGTRTWGGLVGLSGNPALLDGGSVLVPTFRFLDTSGHWAVENEGVAPDIEVVDRPDLVAKGQDPTLEKGIEVLLEALAKNPPARVEVPEIPTPRE